MGKSWQDPKMGNSGAPGGDMTGGAGEARVKLNYLEKVEPSGSGSQAEGRQGSG